MTRYAIGVGVKPHAWSRHPISEAPKDKRILGYIKRTKIVAVCEWQKPDANSGETVGHWIAFGLGKEVVRLWQPLPYRERLTRSPDRRRPGLIRAFVITNNRKGDSTADSEGDNTAGHNTRGAGYSTRRVRNNSHARSSKVNLRRLRRLKHRQQDLIRYPVRPTLHGRASRRRQVLLKQP